MTVTANLAPWSDCGTQQQVMTDVTDYVTQNGPFTGYSVCTLEDNTKVFSSLAGTT
jgi:hypothetical protein